MDGFTSVVTPTLQLPFCLYTLGTQFGMRLKYSKLGPSTNRALAFYLSHTAPRQRAGGCAGSPLWQGIHPGGSVCLSEGGGRCGYCLGPQVPLRSWPISW